MSRPTGFSACVSDPGTLLGNPQQDVRHIAYE